MDLNYHRSAYQANILPIKLHARYALKYFLKSEEKTCLFLIEYLARS